MYVLSADGNIKLKCLLYQFSVHGAKRNLRENQRVNPETDPFYKSSLKTLWEVFKYIKTHPGTSYAELELFLIGINLSGWGRYQPSRKEIPI